MIKGPQRKERENWKSRVVAGAIIHLHFSPSLCYRFLSTRFHRCGKLLRPLTRRRKRQAIIFRKNCSSINDGLSTSTALGIYDRWSRSHCNTDRVFSLQISSYWNCYVTLPVGTVTYTFTMHDSIIIILSLSLYWVSWMFVIIIIIQSVVVYVSLCSIVLSLFITIPIFHLPHTSVFIHASVFLSLALSLSLYLSFSFTFVNHFNL